MMKFDDGDHNVLTFDKVDNDGSNDSNNISDTLDDTGINVSMENDKRDHGTDENDYNPKKDKSSALTNGSMDHSDIFFDVTSSTPLEESTIQTNETTLFYDNEDAIQKKENQDRPSSSQTKQQQEQPLIHDTSYNSIININKSENRTIKTTLNCNHNISLSNNKTEESTPQRLPSQQNLTKEIIANESNNNQNERHNNRDGVKSIEEDEDNKRDDFVRSSARFRSLLSDVFRHVADGFQFVSSRQGSGINGKNESNRKKRRQHPNQNINDNTNRRDKNDERRSLQRRRRNEGTDDANTNMSDDSHNIDPMDEDDQFYDINNKHAADLAREKTAEVLALKRALKEAEAHASAMSAANDTLRDASSITEARMERTTEALRIAGTKAANARVDADAAEARAAALCSQVSSFHSILNETKAALENVQSEHGEIAAATRSVEGKLLKAESEVMRLTREKQRRIAEFQQLEGKFSVLRNDHQIMQEQLETKQDETIQMRKTWMEHKALEQARIHRSERLEKELRDSRNLLVEATSATAESESTSSSLNCTIKQIQQENRSLHQQLKEKSEKEIMTSKNMMESLTQSQREVQSLKMKVAEDEEEIRSLKMDKESNENEISQLRNRISNIETRLYEATTLTNTFRNKNTSVDKSSVDKSFPKTPKIDKKKSESISNKGNDSVHNIPPLRTVTPKSITNMSRIKAYQDTSKNLANSTIIKRINTVSPASKNKCYICKKKSFGMMRACQCGRSDCDVKAHASCIANKKFGVSKTLTLCNNREEPE